MNSLAEWQRAMEYHTQPHNQVAVTGSKRTSGIRENSKVAEKHPRHTLRGCRQQTTHRPATSPGRRRHATPCAEIGKELAKLGAVCMLGPTSACVMFALHVLDRLASFQALRMPGDAPNGSKRNKNEFGQQIPRNPLGAYFCASRHKQPVRDCVLQGGVGQRLRPRLA